MLKYFVTSTLILFSFYNAIGQSLQSVSPVVGLLGSDVGITLKGTGTYFSADVDDYKLSSGDDFLTINEAEVLSDTLVVLKLKIPLTSKVGFYDVNVKMQLHELIIKNGFTIIGGQGKSGLLLNVEPKEGKLEEAVVVRITFENSLKVDPLTSKVYLIKEGVNPISFLSLYSIGDSAIGGLLRVPYYALPGSYSLMISSSSDSLMVLPNAFEIKENPDVGKLLFLEPNLAPRGDSITVLFHTSGTELTKATNVSVHISGTTDIGGYLDWEHLTILDDTTFTVLVKVPDDAVLGLYEVFVSINNTYSLALRDALIVTGHGRVLSVSPNSGRQGEMVSLTINTAQTHFLQQQSVDIAIYNQGIFVRALEFYVEDDTKIENMLLEIPNDCPLGVYHIGIVSTWDGLIELPNSFTVKEYSGLGDQSAVKRTIAVYPNPVKDELKFEIPGTVQKVDIIDLTGRTNQINITDMRHENAVYTLSMDRCQIGKGFYTIRIETGEGIQYQKFIVE